jgi:hypothetical protein
MLDQLVSVDGHSVSAELLVDREAGSIVDPETHQQV